MENLERYLEQVFVDVAMAEERSDSLPLSEDVNDMVEMFECSLVDVTFAEAGEYTATACVPHHH